MFYWTCAFLAVVEGGIAFRQIVCMNTEFDPINQRNGLFSVLGGARLSFQTKPDVKVTQRADLVDEGFRRT